MSNRRFVIVGASLTGAKAAEALRKEGFEGEIVLLGEEPFRPYERPPLSKGFLQGSTEREKVFVHSPSFYDENDIDFRPSQPAVALDPPARQLSLQGGERIGYDACLLATGATPRRLTIPGHDLDGVYYLRDLADAERLQGVLGRGSRLAVIGGGWIGCEVAASARHLGSEVTLIEAGTVPLGRVLGEELGRFYAKLHADHSVDLRLGVAVDSLSGSKGVEQVVLADGTSVACDAVVVGVGVSPRAELAEKAGLVLDNGVVTDDKLATSAAGVYAAGDVANAWHPTYGRRIRLEHWSAALNQGPIAARNMLGQQVPYTKIPYFFSDQYDVGMEYTGFATEWDEIVYRGDPSTREFIAFFLHHGRLVAGMNVNIWGVAEAIETLVAGGASVDRGVLADADADLSRLAAEATGA